MTISAGNFRDKFSIFSPPQSPDIGQNSDRVVSDFRIFGQSLINEIISKTSNDIDMKFETTTKLEIGKRQKKI